MLSKKDYLKSANLLLDQGKLQEAIDNYQILAELTPDESWIYIKLGDVHQSLEQCDEAIENYRKAVSISPERSGLYRKLGNLLVQQDKLQEAIDNYQILTELTPDESWVYTKLGDAHQTLEQCDEAIGNYQRAIKLEPKEFVSYDKLAALFLQTDNIEGALATYREGLAIAPHPALFQEKLNTLSFHQALIQLNSGEVEGSIRLLQDIRGNHPLPDTLSTWIGDWPLEPLPLSKGFDQLKPDDMVWPKVSVITPILDPSDDIDEAMRSVLHQAYPNLEYVIVHRGLTDRTEAFLKRYPDCVREIVIGPNVRLPEAINTVLAEATGDLITVIQTDTLLAPGALFMAALSYRLQGCDIISGMWVGHQDKRITWFNVPTAQPDSPSDLWLRIHYGIQPSFLFTRRAWQDAGGKLDASSADCFDYALWTTLMQGVPNLKVMPYPLTLHRWHPLQTAGLSYISALIRLRHQYAPIHPPAEREVAVIIKLYQWLKVDQKRVLVVTTPTNDDLSKNTFSEDISGKDYHVSFCSDTKLKNHVCSNFDAIVILNYPRHPHQLIEKIYEKSFSGLLINWDAKNHPNHQLAKAVDIHIPGDPIMEDLGRNDHSMISSFIPAAASIGLLEMVTQLFAGSEHLERSNKLFIPLSFDKNHDAFVNQMLYEISGDEGFSSAADHGHVFTEDTFKQWTGHKVSLCLCSTSQNIFDALLCGQVPMVIEHMYALDDLISPEDQANLPVIKLGDYDPEGIQAAYRQALKHFDKEGIEGINRRHRFVMEHHLFTHRLEEVLDRINHLYAEPRQLANADFNLQTDGFYDHLGDLFLTLEKWDQACVAFRYGIRLNRDKIAYHKKLADAAFRVENWSQAATAYSDALSLDADQTDVYPNLALAHFNQSKWEEAEHAYQMAIHFNPDDWRPYHQRGQALINRGNWEEAERCFRQSLEINPDDTACYHSLGNTLSKLEKWEEAAETYGQVAKLNPDTGESYNRLGEVFLKLEQWKEAEKAFKRAAKLNPDADCNYHAWGDVLFDQGKWEKAVKAYALALERCRPHLSWSHKLSVVGWSYHHLGKDLLNQEKWKKAEHAFRRAIALSGECPWHYSGLAEALTRQGKKKKAITAFRQLEKLNRQGIRFQQNPEDALQHMAGWGLVICIYTCEKNRAHQQAIRETWLKEVIQHNIPYFFVIGRPSSRSYVDGDMLYVDAPDIYEHLPRKTYKFCQYIHDHTFYSYVFKVDDDCYVNVKNLLECGFEKYDYMGKPAGSGKMDGWWHFGKTSDPDIGEYQGEYKGQWAGGGFGYFLNRHALRKLVKYPDYEYIAQELYEDKFVADVLRQYDIYPILSDAYIVGEEREIRHTEETLHFDLKAEVSYPHIGNNVVLLHSDHSPHILYQIHRFFYDETYKNRSFLRSVDNDKICLERLDDKTVQVAPEDVLCFIIERNESLRLPFLLKYYRDKRVDKFFIVDNNSSDDTVSFLLEQSDVFLWQTTRSYQWSQYGTEWAEFLMQNYGVNHWCLIIDADELFYYPDCENKDLHRLCEELESENVQAMTTLLLDMYSDKPLKDTLYRKGQNFLDVCPYFDKTCYAWREENSGSDRNQTRYRGGLRGRIFGNDVANNFTLNKAPLFKYDFSVKIKQGCHFIGNVDIAYQTGCLLHFKYFSTFHEYVRQEIDRAEHWNNAREYKQYAQKLTENPDISFFDTNESVKFRDSQQLSEIGIIRRKRRRLSGPSTIFLSGMGRSGTTWISDIINYDKTYRDVFEPFRPDHVKEAQKSPDYQYFKADDRDSDRIRDAETILSGQFRNRWADKSNENFETNRRIIKDIRTNLMLKWLINIRPDMRVILVVRHPLAVVNSWIKLGWDSKKDFDIIVSQERLLHDFPLVKDALQHINPADDFETTLFIWCVLYYVPLKQFKDGEIFVLFYEDLVLNPEKEVEKIFSYIGEIYHNEDVMLRFNNASNTNWLNQDFQRHPQDLINSWRGSFNESHFERTANMLKLFELDELYDSKWETLQT